MRTAAAILDVNIGTAFRADWPTVSLDLHYMVQYIYMHL